MKDIAAIVVTYKFSKEKIKSLVKELNKQKIPKASIFIKDNSIDNVGYGQAINEIVKNKLKNYRYFLILNPDIILSKKSITYLLNSIKSKKKIGIIGPRIINPKNGFYVDGGIVNKSRYSSMLISKKNTRKNTGNDLKMVDYISGTAMLIRKEVFEKIGYFKNEYFLFYEELDFCLRTKAANYSLLINPKARIYHYESVSIGNDSPAKNYYLARNHLLFVERFAPLKIKLRELLRIPKTLYQARQRPFELMGIRDYFLRHFGRNKHILSKADL